MTVIHGRVDRSSAMGATLASGETLFRTWAPAARSVALLAGDDLAAIADPAWRPPADAVLEALGDGSWGGAVAGLGEGEPYLFFVEGTGSSGPKRDPFARELTLAPAFPDSFCVIRDPSAYPWHDAGWQAPPFSALVIYQLHVGTWWALDQAGADVRHTRGGTFLDVASRLGHLQALGINAIQLLPIQEFETRFSLGYNGVDYFSPESRYVATPEEVAWRLPLVNASLAAFGQPPLTAAQLTPGSHQLKCLVDLSHLHGIAVILDLVYNHAGGGFDDHSLWFQDRRPTGNANDSLYFTDHDWAGGQVFAYWNAWVAQFLIDNACFFLTEHHVDGFRYDEVRVIENNGGRSFCQALSGTVRATRPGAIQIAEYWNDDRPSAVRPAPDGLGFDAELGDGLRDALRSLIAQAAGGLGAALDLAPVAAALAVPAAFPDGWRLVQCLENQDVTYSGHGGAARVPALADAGDGQSWYARSRSRLATALLLTAPGIPALFMGEEILEDRNWSDDPGAGGLIAWDGLVAAASARRDFLRCIADLVALRHTEPALRAAGAHVSRAQNFDRILVLHRWVPGEGRDVVIVASLDERPKHGYTIGLPMAGPWREAFNSDVYDGFPNPTPIGNGGWVQAWDAPLDGFSATASLSLPANGVVVLAR